MSRPLLRGVKEIVVSLDMLHSRSQCAREVLRRLSSKKLRTPDLTVRSEIRAGQHPTITVNFMEDGRTMQLDAVKHNANEVFRSIQDEIIRAENWKETVLFRPSLEKQGLL